VIDGVNLLSVRTRKDFPELILNNGDDQGYLLWDTRTGK